MKPDNFEKMARKAVREALSQYEIHGINVMNWLKIIAELPPNTKLINAEELYTKVQDMPFYDERDINDVCDLIANASVIISTEKSDNNGSTDIDPTAEAQT